MTTKSNVVTLVEKLGAGVPLTARPGTPPRVATYEGFSTVEKTAVPGRPPAIAPSPPAPPPPAPAPQSAGAGTGGKK